MCCYHPHEPWTVAFFRWQHGWLLAIFSRQPHADLLVSLVKRPIPHAAGCHCKWRALGGRDHPKNAFLSGSIVLLPGAVGEVTMSAYKSLNASKSKNTLGIRWEKRYSHESKHQSGWVLVIHRPWISFGYQVQRWLPFTMPFTRVFPLRSYMPQKPCTAD